MEFNWKDKEFLQNLKTDLDKRFLKAGFYFVSELRKALNVSQNYRRYTGVTGVIYRGLNPSAPGSYPHKLSGQLQKSMAFNYDQKKMVLTVGSSLKGYPGFLQFGTKHMKSRPWLSLGFNANKDTLAKILLGKK